MEKLKYNCIFGGGAVRGMCYVGALKALRELNIEICSLAGSSVGAVFASLLACGYSAEEIENMFISFNFNIFRDINLGFSPDLSFSKGEVFLNWLRDNFSLKIFGHKDRSNPVCFKDLKNDLYILTTDLTNHTPFVFSKKSTPDVEVAFAVRASAGMPGLMKPVKYNNSVLVDGDLSKSWAIWKTDKDLVHCTQRVLEFRLEGSSDENIKNPIDYLTTVYNSFSYLCTSNIIERYGKKDKFDYIVFDTKDLLLVDFSISADERYKLINQGYNDTIEYFKTVLLNKKRMLLPLYTFLLGKIVELKLCVFSNNYSLSINKINEILSSSIELFEYADTIYNSKLLELRECIKNSRQSGLFSSNKIADRQRILSVIESVCNDLENHISDLNEYLNFYKNIH